MPALTTKVMIVKYMPAKFKDGQEIKDGVNIDVNYLEAKAELPIRGAVDFTVYNVGTAKAYLFGKNVEILAGQSWSPPKSTGLPIANQPELKFEGDYALSRNVADLSNAATTASA